MMHGQQNVSLEFYCHVVIRTCACFLGTKETKT